MKRTVLLILILLLLLCGCRKEDSVIFYYRPVDFLNDGSMSLLSPESRVVTGYAENPQFLISLYLTGPLDPELESPFPKGTKFQSLMISGTQLTVYLHSLPQVISDAEFSLACACLSMSCMEFTAAESVTIHCGSRCVTMDRSILTLTDEPVPTQTTTGGS